MNKEKNGYKSKNTSLLILCCVAFFSPLHAQYDDLLRKSRYTWVAEYTADYELNPVYSDKVDAEMNLARTIRLENANHKNGLFKEPELKHYLSQALLHGLASNAFVCFADEQFSQPLSSEKVLALLTRPETKTDFNHPYDTITRLNEVRPEEIDLFRIRQVFFFDSLEKRFGSRLLALAPILKKQGVKGNLTGNQPLLWIKFHSRNHRQTEKIAQNATYIVQTFMRQNAPYMEDMKSVKGESFLNFWAGSEVFEPTHKNLTADGFLEVGSDTLLAQIDTKSERIFIDPETNQKRVKLVYDEHLSVGLKACFVQNWYFDERRYRLAAEVVAVAPMAPIFDIEGNLRYFKPLFYSKY